MKKFKKLQKGMTLLEVVIAISYFSIMMVGITYIFAGVVKYNARNQKRDKEISLQENSIEGYNAAGVKPMNGKESSTLTFNNGSKTFSVDVSNYSAIKSEPMENPDESGISANEKQRRKDNMIPFEVKTFSSGTLGVKQVVTHDGENSGDKNHKCKIRIENYSSVPLTVGFDLGTGDKGKFYEGDYKDDYNHSSNLIERTIKGYKQDLLDSSTATGVKKEYYEFFKNDDNKKNYGVTPQVIEFGFRRSDGVDDADINAVALHYKSVDNTSSIGVCPAGTLCDLTSDTVTIKITGDNFDQLQFN